MEGQGNHIDFWQLVLVPNQLNYACDGFKRSQFKDIQSAGDLIAECIEETAGKALTAEGQ